MYKVRLFSGYEFDCDGLINDIGVSLQNRESSTISEVLSEITPESLKVVEFTDDSGIKTAFRDVEVYKVNLSPITLPSEIRYDVDIHLLGYKI